MNKYQRFIEDMQAFIRWGSDNNKSTEWILSNLTHDINGVANEGLGNVFVPRVTGCAKEVDEATHYKALQQCDDFRGEDDPNTRGEEQAP